MLPYLLLILLDIVKPRFTLGNCASQKYRKCVFMSIPAHGRMKFSSVNTARLSIASL